MSAASAVAKTAARQWGQPWRELLGAAWVGADSASRTPGLMRVAARRELIDEVRVRSFHDRLAPAGDTAGATARRHAPPVEHRLLALWCDARGSRVLIPLGLRVMAYLHLVEGLSLDEVGEMFGATRSVMSRRMARFRELVAR